MRRPPALPAQRVLPALPALPAPRARPAQPALPALPVPRARPAISALPAHPALPAPAALPALAALLALVAACTPAPRVAPAPPPPTAAPSTLGMERVMGASPEAVIAILGRPSLDREEGPARHLQFSHGNVCTLDLFFYPRPPAGGRVATHAEARRRDGSPLDPASCLESQFLSRPIG